MMSAELYAIVRGLGNVLGTPGRHFWRRQVRVV